MFVLYSPQNRLEILVIRQQQQRRHKNAPELQTTHRPWPVAQWAIAKAASPTAGK
jgi:hypothetical protein